MEAFYTAAAAGVPTLAIAFATAIALAVPAAIALGGLKYTTAWGKKILSKIMNPRA